MSDNAEATIFKLKEVQDKPFRVVIDLKFPEIEKKESEERKQFKMARKDKIIIIDPGHGGEDPGAIGPRKTMEKDVVLQIAKKLEYALNQKKGYRAFLTRNDDYYPSFKKRLRIAREYGANLFVSIHADASRSRQVHGSSVYCLSTTGASSVAARLLARQENLADIVGGSESDQANDESDPITLHMIQTETINMSKMLGTAVLEHLKQISAIKFPRIQEAQFIVLKLPDIPSILVETGFISNPREELLLRNNRYQKQLALALSASIQNFLHDPEPDKDAIQIAMNEDKETEDGIEKNEQPKEEYQSRPVPRMILYKVKQGESIERVAQKFNSTPGALLKLNNMKTTAPLIAGTKLKVYLPVNDEKVESPPKEKQTVREPSSAKSDIYTVKKGDTLEKIAKKNNVPIDVLMKKNKIKPGTPLFVNKRLMIAPPSVSEENQHAPPPTTAKPKIHVVKKGDTLEKIAKKNGVPLSDLLKANRMNPRDALWVDRKIKIP